MTTDEAALEAFCEQYFCWWRLPDTTDEMREAQRVHIRPAILAYEQHRGKQEPVGYISAQKLRQLRYPTDEEKREQISGTYSISAIISRELSDRVRDVPLYASPQPADVGALREALEKIKRVPSQRHTSGHLSNCPWCNGSSDIAKAALATSGGAQWQT